MFCPISWMIIPLNSFIPFKRFKPEPSGPHSFKLKVISIEPVVINAVVKMIWKRVKDIKEIRA